MGAADGHGVRGGGARGIVRARAANRGDAVAPIIHGARRRARDVDDSAGVAGHPALAIIWKNMLCLRRTAQLRVFVGPLAMAIAVGMAFSTGLDTAAHVARVGTALRRDCC